MVEAEQIMREAEKHENVKDDMIRDLRRQLRQQRKLEISWKQQVEAIDLRRAITSLEEDKKQLELKIQKMMTQVARAKRELESEVVKSNSMREHVAKADEQVKKIKILHKRKIYSLSAQILDLTKLLGVAQGDLQAAKTELQDLKREINVNKSIAEEELGVCRKNYRKEIAKLKERHDEEMANHKRQHEKEKRKELELLAREKERERVEFGELFERTAAQHLQNEVVAMTKTMDAMKASMGVKDNRINELLHGVQAKQEENQCLQVTIRELQAELEQAKTWEDDRPLVAVARPTNEDEVTLLKDTVERLKKEARLAFYMFIHGINLLNR